MIRRRGTLPRSGVSTAAALAYWLGNPLLNSAVLVFLVLVAPWQWTVTRLVVAALVVVGGAALVARLVEGRTEGRADVAQLTEEAGEAEARGRRSGVADRRLPRLAKRRCNNCASPKNGRADQAERQPAGTTRPGRLWVYG